MNAWMDGCVLLCEMRKMASTIGPSCCIGFCGFLFFCGIRLFFFSFSFRLCAGKNVNFQREITLLYIVHRMYNHFSVTTLLSLLSRIFAWTFLRNRNERNVSALKWIAFKRTTIGKHFIRLNSAMSQKIRGECMKHEQRHNETHIHQSWRQEGQLTAVVTISIFVMSWKWHFYINIATVYCVDAHTAQTIQMAFFFTPFLFFLCNILLECVICLFAYTLAYMHNVFIDILLLLLLLVLMCCIHYSVPFAVCITHAMLYHSFLSVFRMITNRIQ